MREVSQAELNQNTQKLLDGPLKHVRAAALAAVLVPLASLVATPTSAQDACASGATICAFVFDDANHNGIQDSGEAGIQGVVVSITDGTTILASATTGPDGLYFLGFGVPDGTYTIFATTPQGFTTSPPNQ